MKIAILGRTHLLLAAARLVRDRGHQIVLVGTCRSENHYQAGEAEFRQFADECGAPFFLTPRFSQTEVELIKASGAELGLSINWLTLVPQSVIDLFPSGVLNAHAGDLPRFRGNACPNWAILAGESRVGLCIHQMVEQLDAGDVVMREYFPLDDQTYIGDVYNWLDEQVPRMMADAVEGLATGRLTPSPQTGEPLRVYPRRPEDGRVVWQQSAQAVHRLIRATSRPFDGAFSTLEGQTKVTIWRASRWSDPGSFLAVPGQVMLSIEGDPVIACGDGALRLEEVEIDGLSIDASKRMILKSLRNRLI